MNLKVKFKLSIVIIINYLTCWPGQSAYITFQILVVHRTTHSMPFLTHDHITEKYKKCSYTMASHSSGTPLYRLTCIQLGHQLTCIQLGRLPQPFLPVSSLGIFHSRSYLYPAWASSTASLLNSLYMVLLKRCLRKKDQKRNMVFISCDWPTPSRLRSSTKKSTNPVVPLAGHTLLSGDFLHRQGSWGRVRIMGKGHTAFPVWGFFS